jgi:hypothetical protein
VGLPQPETPFRVRRHRLLEFAIVAGEHLANKCRAIRTRRHVILSGAPEREDGTSTSHPPQLFSLILPTQTPRLDLHPHLIDITHAANRVVHCATTHTLGDLPVALQGHRKRTRHSHRLLLQSRKFRSPLPPPPQRICGSSSFSTSTQDAVRHRVVAVCLSLLNELSRLGLCFEEVEISSMPHSPGWPEFVKSVVDAFGVGLKCLGLFDSPERAYALP